LSVLLLAIVLSVLLLAIVLSVLLLAIVLSVLLWFKVSNYHFSIFKAFLDLDKFLCILSSYFWKLVCLVGYRSGTFGKPQF
jgi:hypothetical protein